MEKFADDKGNSFGQKVLRHLKSSFSGSKTDDDEIRDWSDGVYTALQKLGGKFSMMIEKPGRERSLLTVI